ncbi:MAG: oligosaccharide flippase family protein [Bacteroidales bacterium]|nr:oligosaccharide flippase family protein [Bacteroidales bacterium]MDY6406611.1 oligosaccharide flippase family protein [Bacteroidales bacterium]
MWHKIRDIWHNNTKVVENYAFMTILQVLNICFYLLIYPFLIRVLGAESYGLYAFAIAVVTLFITFVSFGFDLPAAKKIAENTDNKEIMSQVLSEVTATKVLLEMIALIIYSCLFLISAKMRDNALLFAIVFAQTITSIVFPQWYFQGVQRMRVVTYIQVAFKFATLPFIFWLLRSPDDCWIYALIASVSSVGGGLVAWLIVRFKDGLKMRYVALPAVWRSIREVAPFFLSNVTGVVKEQGIVLLIGQFLGMSEVAIYDLANKIIIIPRTIFSKLNDALYPKMMAQPSPTRRRKVLIGEVIIGLGAIAFIAALGYWAVLILGGREMMSSYPVSVILSVTILTWLVAGAMIYFYIIPSGKTFYITWNQLIAMLTTFAFAGIGLFFTHSVYILAASLALSGLIEILFCSIIIRYKLRI